MNQNGWTSGNSPWKCLIWLLLVFPLGWAAEPQRIVLPDDSSVLDVKRDLGAKGDGMADDTDALQRGIDLSCGYEQAVTKAVYLPAGTYRVTKSLVVHNSLGPWLYGESRDQTIIKLDDRVSGVTAVLRTHPRETGPTSADWFMRNIRNLTIDVGNNPETDGIRYYATNSGILKDIRVIGNGKIGINSGFLDQSGPNLIQDVEIDGFQTGILSQWIWGQTLSRIRIKNCWQVGLEVTANVVAVEDLVVENCPLPVWTRIPNNWGHWGGIVALVGGQFTAGPTVGSEPGAAPGPAIRNNAFLFARDVQTTGYQQAIENTASEYQFSGTTVSEYSSHVKRTLQDEPSVSLRLPIQPEPNLPWETDRSRWLCVNEYGAVPGDNRDDTAAIQKAIDAAAAAGKTTVYFRGCCGNDPNWFNLEGSVRVHGSVRHILGLGWARLLTDSRQGGFVVAEEPTERTEPNKAAEVVKFQHIDAFGGPPVWIENRSAARTVWVESCGVRVLGTGKGPMFLTNCPATLEMKHPGQPVWCRQLNPEGTDDVGLVRNHGGQLWILGMKCEGRGVRCQTTKGGRTEIFGVFIYGPGIEEGDRRPLFDIQDATCAVLGMRELSFGGNCYRVKVREQRGTQVYELDDQRETGWVNWSGFSNQPVINPQVR